MSGDTATATRNGRPFLTTNERNATGNPLGPGTSSHADPSASASTFSTASNSMRIAVKITTSAWRVPASHSFTAVPVPGLAPSSHPLDRLSRTSRRATPWASMRGSSLCSMRGSWLRQVDVHRPSCNRSTSKRNAQRSGAGWVTSRDRLHGRAVARRRVMEMAQRVGRNTVVDGRDSGAGGRPPPCTKMRRRVACFCSDLRATATRSAAARAGSGAR